jgi:hypothetical protein
LFRKSLSWQYEEEYRLLTLPKMCIASLGDDGKQYEFIQVEKAWLKRIDFGSRLLPIDRSRICAIAKELYPGAARYHADFHEKDFALVYRQL